jgi:putative SOS response-associated peptidase YedK
MCNLYRLSTSSGEVATLFKVVDELAGANMSAEVYPGYPGAVIAEGHLRRMTWGFPLQIKGKQGQALKPKPVNNARTDKLGSAFWRSSFEKRRCLIPLTGWAEAEGERGAKTRTWLSLPDQPVFACAGLWRHSEEWGDVYSMVMTFASGTAAECHTRMPVILKADGWDQWQNGNATEAFDLCVPFDGDVTLDRTQQSWVRGRGTVSEAP